MTDEGVPLRWDRRLAIGMACGITLFVAGVAWPERVPPRVDFSAIQVTEGRLFCTSYLGRRGSGFRIDDVPYAGGHCTLQQHGANGPVVRARWVLVPEVQPPRHLLTVTDLKTGALILNLTPESIASRLAADPYDVGKLCLALAGVFVSVLSLAQSHRRAAALLTASNV